MLQDIQDCMDYVNKGGLVAAYLTVHWGKATDDQSEKETDRVQYAFGTLRNVEKEDPNVLEGVLGKDKSFLSGDLTTVFTNTGVKEVSLDKPAKGIDEGMIHKRNLSWLLRVYNDGTIAVQPKIGGKPIGGFEPERLKGSAISPGVLQAASKTTAYSVSLDARGGQPGFK